MVSDSAGGCFGPEGRRKTTARKRIAREVVMVN